MKCIKRIIYLVECYLLFTLFLYFLGPIRWATPNILKLIGFLLVSFFLILFGYFVYFKRHGISICSSDRTDNTLSEKLLIYYVKWMLILNLIIMTMYFFRNLGGRSFSISSIVQWIMHPGTQYLSKTEPNLSGLASIAAALATIGSFFLWGTIPFGLLYFSKLPFFYKVILAFNIAVELLRWFSTGTNKGIVDFVLVVMTFVLYLLLENKITFGKKAKYIILCVVLCVLVLVFFITNIGERLVNAPQTNYVGNANNTIDNNGLLHMYFQGLFELIRYVQSYLTQGYYGLALGLEESVVPMFGLGSSDFLMQEVEGLFNVDLFQYTYMARIDSSMWKPRVQWHSAFLWFANDFGPIGALVYIFVIGYYFAYVVDNLFLKKDRVYFPLFCMMIQMMFYLPMNNQIFQMPFSFMGFWGMNFSLFLLKYTNARPVVISLKR